MRRSEFNLSFCFSRATDPELGYCSQLENNSEPAQSEQGVRKVLYQRVEFLLDLHVFTLLICPLQIVSAFPDGWMNSGNISRESTSDNYLQSQGHLLTSPPVSAIKKKLEKEEIDE